MKRIFYYCTIAIASVLVIGAFVTATNYTQLAIATVAYPILIYFILKAFPRRVYPRAPAIAPAVTAIKVEQPAREEKTVVDLDKREFLKLIGITGLSLFIFSLFNKRSGIPLLGGFAPASNISQVSTTTDVGTNGGLPGGYRISEIDEGVVTFYGFTNDSGAWLIMRNDTQTNSFRYAKGGSNFPGNWANRTNLKYDYYYNLF